MIGWEPCSQNAAHLYSFQFTRKIKAVPGIQSKSNSWWVKKIKSNQCDGLKDREIGIVILKKTGNKCGKRINTNFIIWTRCSKYIISFGLHFGPEEHASPFYDGKNRRGRTVSKEWNDIETKNVFRS